MIQQHLVLMTMQLVDSLVLSTRIYWRRKFFAATDAEANDPRPFRVVLSERESHGR